MRPENQSSSPKDRKFLSFGSRPTRCSGAFPGPSAGSYASSGLPNRQDPPILSLGPAQGSRNPIPDPPGRRHEHTPHRRLTSLRLIGHLTNPVPPDPLEADRWPHDVPGQTLHSGPVLGLDPHPVVQRLEKAVQGDSSAGTGNQALRTGRRSVPSAAWRDITSMSSWWSKGKSCPSVSDPRLEWVSAAATPWSSPSADGLSLINTVNSIVGVDLDTLNPVPHVAGRGSHGGYCGPAVKPIALHMVHALAADPEITIPISGIGGIQAWQDAVEYLLLGASSVQVCTAVMHYGFRLVEHMISGLEHWMIDKGFDRLDDIVGHTVSSIGGWGELDIAYKVVAEIDQDRCIHCGLCYIACEDGAHQSIKRTEVAAEEFVASPGSGGLTIEHSGSRSFMHGAGGGYINRYEIDQETCVGCNLCSLLCPVDKCITMVTRDSGLAQMTWNEYQAKLARGEVEEIGPPEHR